MRHLNRTRAASARNAASDDNSPYTWKTSGPLAARLEAPVTGAWDRLQVGPNRRELLQRAFGEFEPGHAPVLGLVGPARAAKTASALGLASVRALRAVYATEQTDQQAFKPSPEIVVIIDPVSAHDLEHVNSCVEFYKGTSPIILVDRDQERLSSVQGITAIVKLKMPSPSAVAEYARDLIDGYPHRLTSEDLNEIGTRLHGASLFEVNQILLDAAMSKFMVGEDLTIEGFSAAISKHSAASRAHVPEPAGSV